MDIGGTLCNDMFVKVWGNIKIPIKDKLNRSTNRMRIFTDRHLELPVYNSAIASVYNPIWIMSKRNLNRIRW